MSALFFCRVLLFSTFFLLPPKRLIKLVLIPSSSFTPLPPPFPFVLYRLSLCFFAFLSKIRLSILDEEILFLDLLFPNFFHLNSRPLSSACPLVFIVSFLPRASSFRTQRARDLDFLLYQSRPKSGTVLVQVRLDCACVRRVLTHADLNQLCTIFHVEFPEPEIEDACAVRSVYPHTHTHTKLARFLFNEFKRLINVIYTILDGYNKLGIWRHNFLPIVFK